VKAELLREFLLPIIRDQVELVLTGHDHVYCEQRAYGIDFVTASCAGSKFYRCKQRLEDEGECIERMNCFVLVEAGEDFNWRPVFVPKEDEEDG
jgi:tRNA(His) 5'-end guanylyltransferase